MVQSSLCEITFYSNDVDLSLFSLLSPSPVSKQTLNSLHIGSSRCLSVRLHCIHHSICIRVIYFSCCLLCVRWFSFIFTAAGTSLALSLCLLLLLPLNSLNTTTAYIINTQTQPPHGVQATRCGVLSCRLWSISWQLSDFRLKFMALRINSRYGYSVCRLFWKCICYGFVVGYRKEAFARLMERCCCVVIEKRTKKAANCGKTKYNWESI